MNIPIHIALHTLDIGVCRSEKIAKYPNKNQ